MYLQQIDPWLGFQIGRSLTQRNFRQRDGVYGDNGKIDGLLLPDYTTKMMDRSHTNSCGNCHNVPYRDGGAGLTMPKNGGSGRNTPHMFGDGLVEMIGLQMRLQALAIADENRDGWISIEEAKGKSCKITNLPNGINGEQVTVDYGRFDDVDGDGFPDLNPVFFPVFVDENGKRIAFARNLEFPNVAGYTIEVQIFGFGHLYQPFRSPVPTTLRSFTATAFDMHVGLQGYDGTTIKEQSENSFYAQVSNAGAQQFVTAAGRDRGKVRSKKGISLEDPDRDGYCAELTEGDLDMAEWYLLNHPRPGRSEISEDVMAGEKLFGKIGCASCHTPDWHLMAHNPKAKDYTQRFDGDRRFFDLQVSHNAKTNRLEGKLVKLTKMMGSKLVPKREAVTVRGVYSDFKYHDLGKDFHQLQYDGTKVKLFRTTPLWGVGTTAPYGHDGASLTLDSVIRRHGGEALDSRQMYAKLTGFQRYQVQEFLRSLVLYQTDQLPTDMNDDGKISDHFMVQEMDTGIERFNPEWLFKVPGKIEGEITNVLEETVISHALTNLDEAYGLTFPFILDSDGDGFPNVIDEDPYRPGYRNGVK